MMGFLCNELLQNKAVIRQIEGSLETVAQLKKERFVLDTKIRKLRQLHSRKVRMEAVGVIINKTGDTITIEKKDNDGDDNNPNNTNTNQTIDGTTGPDEIHHDDEVEDMSENESEGTQPEEEEDKNLSADELGKKLDKLLKQSEEQLQKLNNSSKQLRAHVFGQDRYWRRYWELPCAGGIFVESMESAEPEILNLQSELDEKWKNIDEKIDNSNDKKIDNDDNNEKIDNSIKNDNEEKDEKIIIENTDTEINENIVKNEINDDKIIKIEETSMNDAKTNVTSDEIKQETEIIEIDKKIEKIQQYDDNQKQIKKSENKIII